MTKDLLEQYPDICAEIDELTEQMRAGVSDTVSGSSPGYPYIKHTVSIRGVPIDLTERRDTLLAQKSEIEAFVAHLPNSFQRRIVSLRAIRGYSWSSVEAKIGHRRTLSSIKKTYYRAIKEN